jgi:hypothetical protein
LELALPITLVIGKTRNASLVVWQLFFLGIIAMMEVPLIFYFIFAPSAFLSLPVRDADS